MKRFFRYFSLFEWILWLTSIITIVTFFIVFQNNQYLYLFTAITGVTSLILLAKGNLIGLILSILFSVIYAIVSFFTKYYSEVITYAFMTLPISILSLVQWIKNPFKGKKTEVEIVEIPGKDYLNIFASGAVITIFFYFVLEWLNTPNIIFSTISIFTSFVACYLSAKRSRFYAIAYCLNDIVLIVLWAIACVSDLSYLAIVLCFASFLVNDFYGFINWTKMLKRQKGEKHD